MSLSIPKPSHILKLELKVKGSHLEKESHNFVFSDSHISHMAVKKLPEFPIQTCFQQFQLSHAVFGPKVIVSCRKVFLNTQKIIQPHISLAWWTVFHIKMTTLALEYPATAGN